jgi:hypothetical protein
MVSFGSLAFVESPAAAPPTGPILPPASPTTPIVMTRDGTWQIPPGTPPHVLGRKVLIAVQSVGDPPVLRSGDTLPEAADLVDAFLSQECVRRYKALRTRLVACITAHQKTVDAVKDAERAFVDAARDAGDLVKAQAVADKARRDRDNAAAAIPVIREAAAEAYAEVLAEHEDSQSRAHRDLHNLCVAEIHECEAELLEAVAPHVARLTLLRARREHSQGNFFPPIAQVVEPLPG